MVVLPFIIELYNVAVGSGGIGVSVGGATVGGATVGGDTVGGATVGGATVGGTTVGFFVNELAYPAIQKNVNYGINNTVIIYSINK